jgi:hypothetical protein
MARTTALIEWRWRRELAVAVKHNRRGEQLIWTWGHQLLVHESLAAEFKKAGLTGYRLKPALVRFPFGRWAEEYRELVVAGWAGIAPEASGIHVIKRCPACHPTRYSGLVHPKKLIDWKQWTGEDFFIVWPLGKVYILVTERVAGLLENLKVKSYALERPNRKWGDFPYEVTRLSVHLPDDVARKYGVPLGIETRTAKWIPHKKAFPSKPSSPDR